MGEAFREVVRDVFVVFAMTFMGQPDDPCNGVLAGD